ncbi:MAG: hypothetical protein ACT4QF_09425 [Sporichthyaceae bacterium]
MSSEQLSGLPVPKRATVVGWLGIASLPGMLFCGLGVVTAVMALAMAPSARREILAAEGRLGGLRLVRTATVCSWVSVVLAVVGAATAIGAVLWLIDRHG